MRSQEDLTPESTKSILGAFAKGQKPKPGPQSGRQTSENAAGLTTLTTKVHSKTLSSFPVADYFISLMVQESFVYPSSSSRYIHHKSFKDRILHHSS